MDRQDGQDGNCKITKIGWKLVWNRGTKGESASL